jgi:hypothetical protein
MKMVIVMKENGFKKKNTDMENTYIKLQVNIKINNNI